MSHKTALTVSENLRFVAPGSLDHLSHCTSIVLWVKHVQHCPVLWVHLELWRKLSVISCLAELRVLPLEGAWMSSREPVVFRWEVRLYLPVNDRAGLL